MQRRVFLRNCWLLGTGLASGGAAFLAPRHPLAGEAASRKALRYQGTHILTHGALRQLAAQYNHLGQGKLLVAGGGCDDGITATRKGMVDLGGMCCPIPGSRAEGLESLQVARDIKVVVTHPSTIPDGIALTDLKAVASGRISHWGELGGAARPIALVVRRHCPEFFEPVRHPLLDDKPKWSRRALFVDTDQQLIGTVARFRASLGLVSWVFARRWVEEGRLKVLAVNDARPTLAAVRNGSYSLTGPMNIVFKRWQNATMRPFFDFLYSDAGAAIIASKLVPVSAETAGYRPTREV